MAPDNRVSVVPCETVQSHAGHGPCHSPPGINVRGCRMPGVRCQHHASQSGPAFLVLLSQQGHHCSPVLVGERCWWGAGAYLGAMGGCRKGAPCRCSACNSTHGFAAKSLLWVCRGAEQLSLQHPAPASRMPAASRSASCSLLSTFSLTEGGEKASLGFGRGHQGWMLQALRRWRCPAEGAGSGAPWCYPGEWQQ